MKAYDWFMNDMKSSSGSKMKQMKKAEGEVQNNSASNE